MNFVYLKKGSVVLVVLVLCMPLSMMMKNKSVVQASEYHEAQNVVGINASLIHSFCKNLSDIVYKYYDPQIEIPKGRWFGSDGEHQAAESIEDNFTNWGLDTKIDKINKNSAIFLTKYIHPVNSDLEINDYSLTVYDKTEQNDFPVTDAYITPRWNHTILCVLDRTKLTYEFEEENIKILPRPMDWNDYFDNLINEIISDLLSDFTIRGIIDIIQELINKLEKDYELTILDLLDPDSEFNVTELPWYNSTIAGSVDSDFIFIAENPSFNPKNVHPSWYTAIKNYENPECGIAIDLLIDFIKKAKMIFDMHMWNFCYNDYENDYTCKGIIFFDHNTENETYDMNYHHFYPLPVIYINNSLGTIINNSRDNYLINYTLDQAWSDQDISSYNVIGKRTGEDTGRTLILSCLYDSLFNQGSVDSAIGMSIVMAIAQYITENNIPLSQNIKFIAFGGEEAGMRGAYSYEKQYRKPRYYKNERDLTVIDLNQLGFNQTDPRMALYCIMNKEGWNATVRAIANRTHYTERTDQYTNFTTINTSKFDPISDYLPFMERDTLFPLWNAKTFCFLKEHDKIPRARWKYHHRTGINYTNGDSMFLYNESFVNISAELIWNLTRYLAVNPFCWFESIDYDVGDASGDNKDDYINISFEIKTVMPHDRVTVRAVLCNTLFQQTVIETENYSITKTGTTGFINISLDDNDPLGLYFLATHLFNSNGEIDNELYNTDDDFAIQYYKYANQTEYKWKQLFSSNVAPSINANPSSQQMTPHAGSTTTYTTQGTDQNNDQLFYQWRFHNPTASSSTYSPWTGPYSSGVNHTYNYSWNDVADEMEVYVRVRDEKLGPNHFSNWSNPLTINVSNGTMFTAPDKILVGNSVNTTGYIYGFNASNWTYTFDPSKGAQKYNQNSSYTYTESNNYTINLTVNDSQNNKYYFEKIIKVLPTISDYTIDNIYVKPNDTITFNSTAETIHNITQSLWDFDDGTNDTGMDVTHNYTSPGIYDVTLKVIDDESNNDTITKKIYVDPHRPMFISATYAPQQRSYEELLSDQTIYDIGVGQEIRFFIDVYDNISGINQVYLNITYPNGNSANFSLSKNSSSQSCYELKFNNTDQIGYYFYTIWMTDNTGNIDASERKSIQVQHLFGSTTPGTFNISVEDSIKGTQYICLENGTADNIQVFLQSNETPVTTAQCMIYKGWDLIGTTEEKNISTDDRPQWITFNFTGTKPTLEKDTSYWLRCWSDGPCTISYDTTSTSVSYTYNESYDGNPPDEIVIIDANPPPPEHLRLYSIYCEYSNKPLISDMSQTFETIGPGFNTTITANVTDSSGIASVMINISYPDWINETGRDIGNNTILNVSMVHTANDTYAFIFSDTWLVGEYNYTIYATDIFGNIQNSSQYMFNVSANATISVCTQYDSYQDNTMINLTDPPSSGPCLVDHEFIENNTVLHFWNKYDNYYLNTTSGVQLTNHKDDYWSHNVLILGYYQGGEWKKLYRTDELTGFTMDIDDTHNDYLNVTFWKNVMANGYPLRLAIRYHLGYEDNELTVIPYIKSRAGAVPYQLGFGWELKDIQIDMTTSGDYIDVNQTTYYLNQTLNNTYTNLETSMFQIQEDITTDTMKSLYMRWNENLTYKLQVKSRTSQYNAPVTLFIKVGTLAAGQEKSTDLFWYDASQVTHYFDDYDDREWYWTTNPKNMADGNISSYASTETPNDIELLNSTSIGDFCDSSSTITKVEIRAYGYSEENEHIIYLRPVFGGSDEGSNHDFNTKDNPGWSQYFDITEDDNAPETWSWSDVANLDCVVESTDGRIWYCSKVEVRVTHNKLPSITNPQPAHNSEGVSLTPTLNITVSDPNGDSMTLTWLSNSSGNWTTFGTSTSVSNGTYHQTFSNATVNGQWWYWRVQVNDGTGTKTSSIYKFYTGYQSKIKNCGSTVMKGYLSFEIQKYNATSETWNLVLLPIYESFTRIINYSGQGTEFGLDMIFNGWLNSSYLDFDGNGTYQIYAAFNSPYGEPLFTDDLRRLEATYEFTITFS
jgi:PKD repeat protein